MSPPRIVWQWPTSGLRIVARERAQGPGEDPKSLGTFGDGLYLERRSTNAMGETVWNVTREARNFLDALSLIVPRYELALLEVEELRGDVRELREELEQLQPAPTEAPPAPSMAIDDEGIF